MTQPPTPPYGDRDPHQVDPYVDTVEQPVVPQTWTSDPFEDTGTQDTGTQYTGTQYTGTQDAGTQDTGTKEAAAHEATEVKDTAVQAGQQVAGTAKEQVQNVAAEAGQQTKQLWQQTVSELGGQASSQQQRLAGTITSFSEELGSMASSSNESGLMTDLAHEASRRGGEVAQWLENREPKDLLEDVRSFARRRPFAFLAIAATAGVVAGRLTRGLATEAKADHDRTAAPQVSGGTQTPQLDTGAQQEWTVPAEPERANMSLQEVPTSGTGAGPTYDAPLDEAPHGQSADDLYGRPTDQGGLR